MLTYERDGDRELRESQGGIPCEKLLLSELPIITLVISGSGSFGCTRKIFKTQHSTHLTPRNLEIMIQEINGSVQLGLTLLVTKSNDNMGMHVYGIKFFIGKI